METLGPKDRREAVALFRSQVIGWLVALVLERGELKDELLRLSKKRFRPPGALRTRTYSVPTLQRWYYAFRGGGLEALKPKERTDKGRAQELTGEQRGLLLDIRQEYPRASAPLILRTLVAEGCLQEGEVSASTVRRLFVEHGLDRVSMREARAGKGRRRWQAEHPGDLWHADVCHGPILRQGDRSVPLRIHALLDDASRYVVAIEACSNEREVEMLGLLVKALRVHRRPKTLYLDNGPTYSGKALATACGRLGIRLVHAKPYDPQARGKMERWWRTLREGCLDYIGKESSLHDVQVRLLAFLSQHYHVAPHASLMGQSPESAWQDRSNGDDPDTMTDEKLREALIVRGRRRVRRDSTLSTGGMDWELDGAWLVGRIVTVARTFFDLAEPPWVEHDGKVFELRPVDPVANARKGRRKLPKAGRGIDAVPFDPPSALLDRALGRPGKGGKR